VSTPRTDTDSILAPKFHSVNAVICLLGDSTRHARELLT
jgi:hypothetical protein